MGKRRKSRELAIQLLYQLEMSSSDVSQAMELFWGNNNHPEDVREFTNLLVTGTMEHKARIDKIIIKTAQNWAFTRITPVDRSILREAVFEIFFCDDIPYKVTLNEAIELGKKFGSEKSGAFINGVLDNARQHNPDTVEQQ